MDTSNLYVHSFDHRLFSLTLYRDKPRSRVASQSVHRDVVPSTRALPRLYVYVLQTPFSRLLVQTGREVASLCRRG
jgi:hypothetical protein